MNFFKYYKRHYTEVKIKLFEENGITVIPKTKEEKTVYGILEWLATHNERMPSGKSADKQEQSLYNSFKINK